MTLLSRSALFLTALFVFGQAKAADPGPFFEPDQPFFQSQVEVVAAPKEDARLGNFVVRGLVLPLASGHCVVFDQELLRVAALWKIPPGESPITPMTMAQISYVVTKRKANSNHPQPTGRVILQTDVHPGVAAAVEALHHDPRPPAWSGDVGRGALPASIARFEGVETAGSTAVLHYRVRESLVREWLETRDVDGGTWLLRHFEVEPALQGLVFNLGRVENAPWNIEEGRTGAAAKAADGSEVGVRANHGGITLVEQQGELVAKVAGSPRSQTFTIGFVLRPATAAATSGAAIPAPPATPLRPERVAARRWPQAVTAPVQLASLQQNGLILDRIATPDDNPWKRRVRVSDLAFLSSDRAAVLTYDGDVWIVDGYDDPDLSRLTWRRFASGLHEPLAIAAPRGVIQVATKNGVVRLYDRDRNGEADWYRNFNDQMIQSQTTRSFPLDMAIDPAGWTYVPQGGIVTRSGLPSGGEGNAQTGAILKISPDGRTSEVFATGAREPFLTVHPRTGIVTASDQQGNYIPSSVSYLVRKGDEFGFMQDNPPKLTPALVWIPHEQDISSSSQVWMLGNGMGPWNGRLLHLSYGTGRIFLIAPDLDAPIPQGAVVPLDLKTDLPLLHARMHPAGNAVFFAGFQIWGTRTSTNWALGRLRPGPSPIVTALAARSCKDGIVLEFAAPIDASSLRPESVSVRAWNYKRSAAYGSGRYKLDGGAGTTPLGIAQTVVSQDGKSVFVHVPELPPAMQVEVRHDFNRLDGAPARGVAYLTIHEPRALDLAKAGFKSVDLTKRAVALAKAQEEPASVAQGKTLSENLGCIACHSTDGTTEGKVGPTWRRLYGSKRTFIDGTTEVADELYLREKILDPQQKKMKPGQVEMPSYRGVLSEPQLESIVLYIRSLRAAARDASDDDR